MLHGTTILNKDKDMASEKIQKRAEKHIAQFGGSEEAMMEHALKISMEETVSICQQEKQKNICCKQLVIIRHSLRIDGGLTDMGITEEGIELARIEAQKLLETLNFNCDEPVCIFVSPFLRCLETAREYIYTLREYGHTVKIFVEFGLSEAYYKFFAKKALPEELVERCTAIENFSKYFPEIEAEFSPFCSAPGYIQESGSESQQRLANKLLEIQKNYSSKNPILAITHGDATAGFALCALNKTIYEVQECSFLVANIDDDDQIYMDKHRRVCLLE